jgi:hypothetical protein
LNENRNITTGGIDRHGSHGKYSIFYQENIFQIIFHVSNLIREDRSKNILNNHYINFKKISINFIINLKRLISIQKKIIIIII